MRVISLMRGSSIVKQSASAPNVCKTMRSVLGVDLPPQEIVAVLGGPIAGPACVCYGRVGKHACVCVYM